MILNDEDKEREQLAQCICTLKSLGKESDDVEEKWLLNMAIIYLQAAHTEEVTCEKE